MRSIRRARPADLPLIVDVELASGALFASIGMTADALAGPPDSEVLREQIQDKRLWVAVDAQDRPVGFIALTIVDADAHLAQVSVEPGHARRGIGRELIERAVAWSREQELPAMTLTTYADVPWNAPYYERCGFRRMSEAEWTPGLRAIREAEIAVGLDEWPRLCMIREL